MSVSNHSLDSDQVCSTASSLNDEESSFTMLTNTSSYRDICAQSKGIGDFTAGRAILPIVELRPFVKKSWRRERSLPSFYEKKETASPMLATSADTVERVSAANIDTFIVSKADIVVKGNARESTESKNNRKMAANVLNISTDRVFQKIHPKTKSVVDYNTHAHSFQTSSDRFRCTRINNFFIQKKNDNKSDIIVQKRHEGERAGKRVTSHKNGAKKKRFAFLEPFSRYRHKLEGSCLKLPTCFRSQLSVEGGENVAVAKTESVAGVYDGFDLNGSLPSIHIRNATQKFPKSSEDLQFDKTTSFVDQKHDRFLSSNGKKRIKNSLEILGESGPRAVIEHHVTQKLSQTLSHIRRSQTMPRVSYDSSLAGKGFSNVCVSYRGGLTNGEIMLWRGMEQNSRRKPKNAMVRSTGESSGTSFDIPDSGIQSPIGSLIDKSDDCILIHENWY